MKSILELNIKEVIHVTSQEDADKLLAKFDELGLKWCNQESYLVLNHWHKYNEKTCYSPKGGEYSPIDFYQSYGYTVYKMEDLKEFQYLYSLDDLVLEEKYAIHVPDMETAKLVCHVFHERGMTWGQSGHSFTKVIWDIYQSETCYDPFNRLQCSRSHYIGRGATILSVDQIKEFQSFKNNTMKTTKQNLLTIYGKDGCNEFNNALEEILKSNFNISDSTEFIISPSYLERARAKCSSTQKDLLESIGIKLKSSNWTRDKEVSVNFWYLTRGNNDGTSTPFKVEYGTNKSRKAVICYKTKEIAEQELKIFNLMTLMRNWARYHNQMDGYKPNWEGRKSNYGIIMTHGFLKTDDLMLKNQFVFQITVSSSKRAKEMFEEFKAELNEIIPYL